MTQRKPFQWPRNSASACRIFLFVHLLMARPSSAQDCIEYSDYMFAIGSVEAPDTRGVAISPGTALVADGERGLLVVDVTDASAPEIAAEVPVPGRPSAVAISGSYALVASYEAGLAVVQLTPGPPHLVGLCSDPYFALDVAVVGAHAYVADPIHGVSVVDFATDPAAPMVVGHLLTPGQPTGIALGGSRAVVAMFDGGIAVLDLSDLQHPSLLGSADTQGFARDVALVGDHAYVADITRGLQVFDVSNSVQPQLVGSIDTPDLALGVTVDNGVAYLADWDSGLRSYDVSDPAMPLPLGSIELRGSVQGVVVANGQAYLAQTSGGLAIVRIGNAQSPDSMGSIAPPGAAEGVDAEGALAAISYDRGFVLVDVSDPHSPKVMSTQDLKAPVSDVLLQGNRIYAVGRGFWVFDVTDPADPINLWTMGASGLEVAVDGDIAYVANGPVVEVHDIAHFIPNIGFHLTFVGNAQSVVAQNQIAYVAEGGQGLMILDGSDPTDPHLIGRLMLDDTRGVAIDGQTVYVADGRDGLVVVDVSNPKAPIRLGSAGAGLEATAVQYDAGLAYVAIQESGMAVFDVSNPSAPILLGFADTDGHDEDVAVGAGWIMTAGGTCHLLPKQCGMKLTQVGNDSPALMGLSVNPSPIADYGEVRYVLRDPGMVRIATYDATGRCRGVLLESWQAAGDGTVRWNGRGFGQRLPSGAYFIRLETAHGSRTERITVLR